MNINGKTKVLALFGKPVKHSRSPELQNRWIKENGLNWIYVAFEIDKIQTAMAAIRDMNFLGANVTIPYKFSCMEYLDELDSSAEAVKAVNTIVNKDNRLIGYNTDVIGFKKDIEKDIEKLENVLVYGAGGASKAAVQALKLLNKKITIANRTYEKALNISKEFAVEAMDIKKLENNNFDVLVNCSSVGMDGKSLALDLKNFPTVKFVYDMIYEPEETPLLGLAKSRNIPFKNGIGMLECQGRSAFDIWKKNV